MDAHTPGNPETTSILVVDDHPNTDKLHNHVKPLVDVYHDNCVVCINPNYDVKHANYLNVPSFGIRLVGLFLMFPYGFFEAVRGDYDVVVSIGLLPYGLYSLCIQYLLGIPAHLGLIGSGIDVYTQSWYAPVPKFMYRRFETLSVLGSTHKRELSSFDIDPERTFVLTNSIDMDRFSIPSEDAERTYDYLWIGRFSAEKQPELFVDVCAILRDQRDFSAVMIGDGDRFESVRQRISDEGLEDRIDLLGWVDDPAPYYRNARLFVMTSAREAMGLTLVEAMATGLVCVAPDVGNVSDIVTHEENGILIEDATRASIVEWITTLERNPELREFLSHNAMDVRDNYGFENASEDWRRIVGRCVGRE
jgi:glycosyltransferase involved in cell wall biosynthesis